MINNAILASVAVGSPVLVNSHTAEDFKGRLPRFWAAEGRYRPTPADLGTYGIHYPPHYKLRERAISQGNVTENLMQAPRVHCVCTACALRVRCVRMRICIARTLHLRVALRYRLRPSLPCTGGGLQAGAYGDDWHELLLLPIARGRAR